MTIVCFLVSMLQALWLTYVSVAELLQFLNLLLRVTNQFEDISKCTYELFLSYIILPYLEPLQATYTNLCSTMSNLPAPSSCCDFHCCFKRHGMPANFQNSIMKKYHIDTNWYNTLTSYKQMSSLWQHEFPSTSPQCNDFAHIPSLSKAVFFLTMERSIKAAISSHHRCAVTLVCEYICGFNICFLHREYFKPCEFRLLSWIVIGKTSLLQTNQQKGKLVCWVHFCQGTHLASIHHTMAIMKIPWHPKFHTNTNNSEGMKHITFNLTAKMLSRYGSTGILMLEVERKVKQVWSARAQLVNICIIAPFAVP